MPSAVAMLLEECDRVIDRAVVRIAQYRRHAEALRRAGHDSDGAREVLDRMRASLARLRIYRDALAPEERTAGPGSRGSEGTHTPPI